MCMSALVKINSYIWCITYRTFISTCYYSFTQDGATPLYIVSQKGYSDIVNILIRNGADVNLAHNVYIDIMMCHTLTLYIHVHVHVGTHVCHVRLEGLPTKLSLNML